MTTPGSSPSIVSTPKSAESVSLIIVPTPASPRLGSTRCPPSPNLPPRRRRPGGPSRGHRPGRPPRRRRRCQGRHRRRAPNARAAPGRRRSSTPASDGTGELGLRHLRAPLHALVLGLFVELVLRAAARALAMGAKSSPTSGRDVLAREPRRLPGLAVACALLVDRARGDLLGRVLGLPLLEEGVLDVLVLPGPLAPFLHSTWRHRLRSLSWSLVGCRAISGRAARPAR